MPTFVELRNLVSRRVQDVNNTAITVTDVGDTINASIRYWKQKMFWFNEVTDIVTLTANNPVLTPTIPILYLMRDDGMALLDQSYRYVLRHITPTEYDQNDIGQIGRPFAYTYRNGGYELYYYPMDPYQVRIHGIRDYVDLVEDSDTNDFTVYADRLIMFDSMARIYAEIRQDYESAAVFDKAADQEYRNLMTRTANNTTTGTMGIDNSLGRYC